MDEWLEATAPLAAHLIACLSKFAAQTADVNMSLTAIELLWKVTDLAIAASTDRDPSATFAMFEVTATTLQRLALDHRPEIRNCACNTLFSAITAHAHTPAALLTSLRLKAVFDAAVFPLFELAGASSRRAVLANVEAVAPELKKGIKMAVHHSRDTTQKQWSETQTLALKGLARLLKTVTRNMLGEVDAWSGQTWADAVCQACHSK